MSQHAGRATKVTTISLLFGAQLFSYMIRYALGIVAPILMSTYHLSPRTMGYILSGWNWSYTAGVPISGLLVDRFGPWIVMGSGSVVWGISTIALPLAGTAASLFLLRMIFGFAHSMLTPAGASAVSHEFGRRERTKAVAVVFTGNQVGLAICATVAAFILAHLGWKAVFYCIGGASLLLSLAWFLWYPDRRIGGGRSQSQNLHDSKDGRMAGLTLLRYRSTWGISLGQMGYLYAYFFFVSWLPGYLVLERKMTLIESGIASALPFWAGVVGTLGGGWLGDYLVLRGFTLTTSRKSVIGSGLLAATVFVVLAAYVEHSWLAVALLTLCVGSLRLATGSMNSLPIDLAPPALVGSLTSIQNFFGNIGGLLAPIMGGLIISATGSFALALLVAGGMALFGAAAYLFVLGNLDNSVRAPALPVQPTRASCQ